MNKRSYSNRTIIFLVIAIVIMVLADRLTDPRWKKTHREGPVETTVKIETQSQPAPAPEKEASLDDQIAPEIMGPQKPAFEDPPEFSMMGPLLPFKEYKQIETGLEPAWIKNAVPADVPEGKPRVAIIIDDMGMDRKHTNEVIGLPGPLTLAFLPYAGDLKNQTEQARAKGHELMVHVPMEPMNGNLDGGPEVLKPDKTPEEFTKILNDDLSAFDGYVGINNHMGSKMTQDRPGMQRVMAELKKRGLLFVDSRTINTSVAADEAKKAGIPFATRNVFLDNEETSEAVTDALSQVEKQALRKGMAIAIGHPKAETIAALQAWIPTLAAKGIYLVPVSDVVTVPAGANESPALNPAAGP